MNITILLLFVSIYNIYSQSLKMKIALIKDSILKIEPISLKIEFINNSNNSFILTDLFHWGKTEIYLRNDKEKVFKRVEIVNVFPWDNYIMILPNETKLYKDGYWKQPLVDSSLTNYIKKTGKYKLKIKYLTDFEGSSSDFIWSNEVEFNVIKPKKEEKKLLKYLSKLHNPESYVGPSWLETDFTIETRIKESEYIFRTFESSRLLHLVYDTYNQAIESEAYRKKGDNWLENKIYINEKLKSVEVVVKDEYIKRHIKKQLQTTEIEIQEFKKMMEVKKNNNNINKN